ncbi:MAG: CRISPR-associated exonuclease Cas4/endonuclease Cas1 fusion [Phycisphaerae bacterium]|jgi:CRISPR-associated endonuclease Cas1/CRISPR-associated protein Cas4|nr:MAG: CRISPR-associated exonuclease Cas4/endonuclease Cas1 fusion [Phycisphaerae bacterium]
MIDQNPVIAASKELEQTLLPVRMVSEYVYCPRLFHLMYVESRWADNQFTVEGKLVHRRVDQIDHALPDSLGTVSSSDTESSSSNETEQISGDDPPVISRSVPLGSQILGITAKLDLVSSDGQEAVPVETKRGRVPDNPERSYEPEQIQLMCQGLLLREAGYQSDHGILYYAESRTRVTVPFTPELEARARQIIQEVQLAAVQTRLPPPLEDSPKCRGCSLNAICLPDETLALQYSPPDTTVPLTVDGQPLRRLYPVRDDATPLYVQEHGARVGTSRGTITVTKESKKIASARLQDVSQVVLCGNIGVSAQAIHILAEASIPIVHLSGSHWFYAVTHGQSLRNAFDRAAQFRVAEDPQRCLSFAKQLVLDKAANQRTLLRRNITQSDSGLQLALQDIDRCVNQVPGASSVEVLLGLEGAIAAAYFSQFHKLLKPRDFDACWDFTTRNRRPPTDPVNALLSFGYALLAKDFTIALLSEGLDPYWGFYHTPRHGRPALALDLMEPFRPTLVDSAVITAINNGMVSQKDFQNTRSACVMQSEARKAFLRAYESRLDQLITHPLFDYRCSWRVVIRLQARLLSRWLRGDIPQFTSLTTR